MSIVHTNFVETLQPKAVFIYDRKSEIMRFNGNYLIRNVPARILRKILHIYLESGRTEFHHSEFIKDPSITVDTGKNLFVSIKADQMGPRKLPV